MYPLFHIPLTLNPVRLNVPFFTEIKAPVPTAASSSGVTAIDRHFFEKASGNEIGTSFKVRFSIKPTCFINPLVKIDCLS